MGAGPRAERIQITGDALAALRAEGLDPSRTVLVIRFVLGCGGSGYRLTFSDRPLPEGRILETGSGLRISLDDYSYARLEGAAIGYDPGKETEGFFLDHPDAAFAAFC